MSEPAGYLWGKQTLEVKLVEQAKEIGGIYPDSSGSSHGCCVRSDSTSPILVLCSPFSFCSSSDRFLCNTSVLLGFSMQIG